MLGVGETEQIWFQRPRAERAALVAAKFAPRIIESLDFNYR